jgi:hypothetical protein
VEQNLVIIMKIGLEGFILQEEYPTPKPLENMKIIKYERIQYSALGQRRAE